MSETILIKPIFNHVNCTVVAVPSIMRIIGVCNDDATFDRCNNAWRMWFPNMRAYKKSLKIFIYCENKHNYDFAIAQMELAKAILMMSEPEKMQIDESVEDIIARVAKYVRDAVRRM